MTKYIKNYNKSLCHFYGTKVTLKYRKGKKKKTTKEKTEQEENLDNLVV